MSGSFNSHTTRHGIGSACRFDSCLPSLSSDGNCLRSAEAEWARSIVVGLQLHSLRVQRPGPSATLAEVEKWESATWSGRNVQPDAPLLLRDESSRSGSRSESANSFGIQAQ